MGFSKANFGKFVRAAAVTGLLGAAGLTFGGSPALAQDPSPSPSPSPSPEPSTTGGEDPSTTTDAALPTADEQGTTDSLAATGGDVAVPLTLGGVAFGVVLFGRRLLAPRS